MSRWGVDYKELYVMLSDGRFPPMLQESLLQAVEQLHKIPLPDSQGEVTHYPRNAYRARAYMCMEHIVYADDPVQARYKAAELMTRNLRKAYLPDIDPDTIAISSICKTEDDAASGCGLTKKDLDGATKY